MILTIFSGLILALFCVPFGRQINKKLSNFLFLIPLSGFIYFMLQVPLILAGQTKTVRYEWVPTFGINLDFYLDGLSLLFSLLITGIGTLIFLYAAAYLKGRQYLSRFYGYLGLFMTAMLGLVSSNNIILLFVFWELTSISSFFLIGFDNENEEAQKSALTALTITGGGGLLLLGGVILMSNIAETYSIKAMVFSAEELKNHSWYGFILLSIFAGAFTKSAQFPFHFWLPNAMKAPTPVSAYLHSATMVKAGIYLLARFTPILGSTPLWNYSLMFVGGITMLYAAFHSLFRVDMKGILAYSTISALGILVFLLGIGTKDAYTAAAVFILVHALYKATLFLVTGTVDYATGTRDVRALAGLRKVLLPVAIAGIIAALSSAGMPLFYGFIGKDLIYEATTHSFSLDSTFLTVAAILTNIFIGYSGLLVGIKPFTGKLSEEHSNVRLPGWKLWLPPLILALLCIVFGCFPGMTDGLMSYVASAIAGKHFNLDLKLWHGVNTVFILSMITLTGTAFIFFSRRVSNRELIILSTFDKLAPVYLVRKITDGLLAFAKKFTNTMHNGYLRNYTLTIVLFMVGMLSFKLLSGTPLTIDWHHLSSVSFYEVTVAVLMLGAIFLSAMTKSRLTALVALSVVGYAICILYVMYGAPDLAMTQFAIDTLTVVLFVLVLFKLPPFLNFTNTKIKLRDGLISTAFGGIIGWIALTVLNESVNKEVSPYYAENVYKLAKGKNVVNVILVDFRGFDTMFEIIVLAMASIGVYSLLKVKVKKSERE